MSDPLIYRFERGGRTPKAFALLCGSWAILFALWAVFDMATWITLVFVGFTLPTLLDILRDTRGHVEIWPKRIVWSSPLDQRDIGDIDHVRINRRFDFSFRVTVVHLGGATTRMPVDIDPPIARLEPALKEAGIAVERHPFSII